jgi:putative ABC transport system substrate-binding protein
MDRRRERLPALADELFRLKVEIIVVHGGHSARIVQQKSKTIPIVMAEASDALGRGIIQSLARPGGNITGLTSITPVLAAKRLELLKEIVPGLARVAVLWTPKSPASRYAWKVIQRPAQQLGLQLHSMELRSPNDLGKAFGDAVRAGAGALISTSGLIPTFGRKRIMGLAVKSRLPAIFTNAATVNAGGLISYNRATEDLYRRAATYVDKILKGAKPQDLPVEQPTKFRLVVNLKTAKVLGITFPRSILLRADKVIE